MREICVRAVEESLLEVCAFVNEALGMADFSAELQCQIRLVVEDVFVNIPEYAYEGVGESDLPLYGNVLIGCERSVDPPQLVIRFVDAGVPFNPLEAKAVSDSGNQFMEREGGFGIHLVKNNMDLVQYEYRDLKNILTLTKYFGP